MDFLPDFALGGTAWLWKTLFENNGLTKQLNAIKKVFEKCEKWLNLLVENDILFMPYQIGCGTF